MRGDEHIEIEVTAFRFTRESDDCLDALEVFLNHTNLGPLPDGILDVHSGEVVPIAGS